MIFSYEWYYRRSNEVVPEPGEAGNHEGSDADKEKQGDCQRAKQVPMNTGTGTWNKRHLAPKKILESRRTQTDEKMSKMYTPD